MQCPKNKAVELFSHKLVDQMQAYCCPECEGNWIPTDEYEQWQQTQPQQKPEALFPTIDVDYTPSPLDTRAALCPECGHYLSRAKVALKNPFYVERCPNCGGIWCDRGEWEVLQRLGLSATIPQLFSSEWQAQIKAREYTERERAATIEKLGNDVAEKVFVLAEILENHPNGDFGVAYLMRRFEQ